MLNFRVDNLEEINKQLHKANVTIVDEMESYRYGKFLHMEDPEGNRIKRWEAIDEYF
ncbi:MAG: hypothetical protein JKY09_01515 [Crocinitomicaceae bacterium]|nr:hypothetical protein [Crocinitomicaceae bacterium]